MRQNIMNIGKNNRQYFWIGIVMLVFEFIIIFF